MLPRFREVVPVLAHRAALGRDRRADRPAARRRRGRRRLDVVRRGQGRRARRSEQFGKGSIDGLMAAETGDMASIPGHIIPCLALGIPGSAPSAVLMAAMIIHGIQPGPMLMIEHPHFIYEVVAMTSLATDHASCSSACSWCRPLLLVLQDPAHRADADHLPALHRRRVRQRLAPVRHLRDAGDRHRRVLPAPARLPDGAVRARPRARRRCSTRACAAAWCCPTAASAPFFTRPISHRLRDRHDLHDPARTCRRSRRWCSASPAASAGSIQRLASRQA